MNTLHDREGVKKKFYGAVCVSEICIYKIKKLQGETRNQSDIVVELFTTVPPVMGIKLRSKKFLLSIDCFTC